MVLQIKNASWKQQRGMKGKRRGNNSIKIKWHLKKNKSFQCLVFRILSVARLAIASLYILSLVIIESEEKIETSEMRSGKGEA